MERPVYCVMIVLSWDTKNIHGWCETVLCNLHNNLFCEILAPMVTLSGNMLHWTNPHTEGAVVDGYYPAVYLQGNSMSHIKKKLTIYITTCICQRFVLSHKLYFTKQR